MNIPPYEIIKKYCYENKKDERVFNYAYCIYKDTILSSYKDLKENISGDMKKALLTNKNIELFVNKAEYKLKKDNEKVIEPYKKEFSRKNFKMSVYSSILGNFIYSMLLLLIFWVAGSQILSWLQSLVSTVSR